MDSGPYAVLVGDPHAKPTHLEEVGRVFDWALDICVKYKARMILMGDLYDNHGTANLAVFRFWRERLMEAKQAGVLVTILSGNHDADYETSYSWLLAHESHVDRLVGYAPQVRDPGVGPDVAAIPYVRSNDRFVELAHECADIGIRYVLCHQEFAGCQMDNGFYSPNGVDTSKLPEGITFISGHIHRRQQMILHSGFVQVDYIGTNRHITRSDAGEVKGIVLWNRGDDSFRFIPTPPEVAEPFRLMEATPGNEPSDLPDSDRIMIDVRGPQDFVTRFCDKLPPKVRFRTFPVVELRPDAIRESEGIPKAFLRHMKQFAGSHNLDDASSSALLDRIYLRCPSLR